MPDLTLLGLCGSLRKASTNRLLMHEAQRRFDPVRFVEGSLHLPLLDVDIQNDTGIPPEVQALANQIADADAVIIAAPEYNKGISGVLKNALDWISRADGNPWLNKPVAVMSAAAGRAGGERGQSMTRLCLLPFRPSLLPGPELHVGETNSQWDDEGRLINTRNAMALDQLMGDLKIAAKRHAAERA